MRYVNVRSVPPRSTRSRTSAPPFTLLTTYHNNIVQLRRGIPVAHSIYGVPNTINCANYVYFLALERVHVLGNPKVCRHANNEQLDPSFYPTSPPPHQPNPAHPQGHGCVRLRAP